VATIIEHNRWFRGRRFRKRMAMLVMMFFLRTAEANLPRWFRGGSIISPFRQGKNERDGTIFWGRDVD
jgi:hypothetical protein